MIKEFSLPDGKVIFDFEQKIIEFNGKVFPFPANVHNFCSVLANSIYQKDENIKKAFYRVKINGKVKLIQVSYTELEGKVSRKKGIFLSFLDEESNFKKKYFLNLTNVYALWEILREADKYVPVEEVVFEKRNSKVFVNGIEIPDAKARAIFFALDKFLREDDLPPIYQDWEKATVYFFASSKIMEIRDKTGFPRVLGRIKLIPANVYRILSVL